MFSFQNIYTDNINCTNLLFVTGPTKCGKSWFLHEEMQKFANTKTAVSSLNYFETLQKPALFHFDFGQNENVSF